MFDGKSIAVIVPAYNEEKLIGETLTSIPYFVDLIIVINDGSQDQTKEIILGKQKEDSRILLIDHETNLGLGKSLSDGYMESMRREMDVISVMAGDGQMDPDDLAAILYPIVTEKADYVKGNRLLVKRCFEIMPRHRYMGNALLTMLTKFATGYWHIVDPQCGYTAISRQALELIEIENLHAGYGYNAQILAELNIFNLRVVDVPARPVYGKAASGIKLLSYIPKISWLLLRLFLWRLKEKYIVRDFHPLVLFYCMAALLLSRGLYGGVKTAFLVLWYGHSPQPVSLVFTALLVITGFQSLLFAMWFDMDYSRQRLEHSIYYSPEEIEKLQSYSKSSELSRDENT